MKQTFVLLIVLCMLAGCGGPGGYVRQTQQVDGMTIVFEHPASAELLQTYDLFVTLTDATQRPVENADVVLDLDMPTMEMGVKRPVAEPTGNGRYRVTTVYDMDGDWNVTVDVTAGEKQYQAEFEQHVVAQS